MFFVQHECFWFENKQQKHKFWVKRGGLQQNVFLYQPVFCKMSKVIFLGGGGTFFLVNFG